MSRKDQLTAWNNTAGVIRQLLSGTASDERKQEFETVTRQAEMANPWFTKPQIHTALEGICRLLEAVPLENWINRYPEQKISNLKIGVIMAGNIPLAGFHDLLCVLLSGHHVCIKLSSSDPYLLPFISRIYFSFLPEEQNRFTIVTQLREIDAVIATGSNNTSRYFEYYFGKIPHIFRKNRNSAAIISGDENEYDFLLLGRDIFTYYGLGCRNVSKFFVPRDYSFSEFFRNITGFADVMHHHKYMNNFDYHQALYLLNRKPFLTNNFLLVTEDEMLASPVGVLHFEYYNDTGSLNNRLDLLKPELQCVVSKKGPVMPGNAQLPAVDDYADDVDTMAFLCNLN
jgi:hypothetical protein